MLVVVVYILIPYHFALSLRYLARRLSVANGELSSSSAHERVNCKNEYVSRKLTIYSLFFHSIVVTAVYGLRGGNDASDLLACNHVYPARTQSSYNLITVP